MSKLVAFSGLSERDEIGLQALLTIVEHRLVNEVKCTADPLKADIAIIHAGDGQQSDAWQGRHEMFPRAQHFVAYGRDRTTLDAEWYIQLPVRPAHLVSIMNDVTTGGEGNSGKKTSLAINESKASFFDFVQQKDLSGYIRVTMKALEQSGQPDFIIDGLSSRYYFTGSTDQIKTVLSANITDIDFESLEFDEFSDASQHVTGKSLTYLKWAAAYFSPDNQLLSSIPPAGFFKLSRWPDFASLPSDGQAIRLSAFLAQHSAGIDEVAERTGIGRQIVINFLNASSVLGLLKIDVSQPTAPISSGPKTKKLGLIGRFRSRFGFH